MIVRLNGPLPINPILKNFLRVHEPADMNTDEKWKTWELPTDYSESSKGNPNDIQEIFLTHNRIEPTRRIIHQEEDEEVDYGGDTESDQSGSYSEHEEIQTQSEDESSDSALDLDGKSMHPPRRYEDYKDNMNAYWHHPTNFRDYMSRDDARWYAENSRVVIKDPSQKPPTEKSFYRPPREKITITVSLNKQSFETENWSNPSWNQQTSWSSGEWR